MPLNSVYYMNIEHSFQYALSMPKTNGSLTVYRPMEAGKFLRHYFMVPILIPTTCCQAYNIYLTSQRMDCPNIVSRCFI